MKNKLIVVMGPTAVGKTRLAVRLANKFKGEIISADSRQVYKYMDIGTGKDLSEYQINGSKINYHLIDVLHPSEEFNLFRFIQEYNKAFQKIASNRKLPFLVGGTGLYLHAILKSYNLVPVSFEEKYEELNKHTIDELQAKLISLKTKVHNKTDLEDKDRLIKAIIIAEEDNADKIKPVSSNNLVLGVYLEREEIKKRITQRLKTRLNEGMVEEVEALLNKGIGYEKLMFFGLEYKYVALYLRGELNYNDMFQKLNSAIHKFAKRQMTWFRKMEKEGIKINWIKPDDYESAEDLIEKFLAEE